MPRSAIVRLVRHPATHCGALALLAILVRLPYLDWPLISDEGGYAYTAYWWFRGFVLYSNDLWFDRPQGIFLAYQLGAWLAGGAAPGLRLWGAAWAAGTCMFVYLAARTAAGTRVGVLAGVISAVASAMPQVEGFTANAEVFALLPATAAVYFAQKTRFGLAGLLVGLSILLKPSGGTVLAVVVFLLITARGSRGAWLRLAAGTALPLLASFVHGALTVGASRYLFAVAGYRLSIPSDATRALLRAGARSTVASWLPLAAASAIGLSAMPAAPRNLVLAWTASSIAGMALGGRWHAHYFLQVLPPLAVGAALGLASLRSGVRWLRPAAIAVVLAVPLVASMSYWWLPPKAGSWALYRRPGYQVADRVADYVRGHTRPDDSIYVAFYEADIYYLSQRRAAIPALYRLDLAHLPGMADRLAEAVEKREPALVVLLDPPPREARVERFLAALRSGYHVERAFDRVLLLRRNDSVASR